MATAVKEHETIVTCHRKRQHSSELLEPPKGPGVSFIIKELGTGPQRRPCVFGRSSKSPRLNPPKMFKVEKSSVLNRVQSFLPKLKEADQELKERLQSQIEGDATDLDCENVKEGAAHIEMELAVVPLLPSDGDSDSESDTCTSDSEQKVHSTDEHGGTGTL